MGEMTFIHLASGFAATIHDDGSTSTTPLKQCDSCSQWEQSLGGMEYRLADGEAVLWMCYKCRK